MNIGDYIETRYVVEVAGVATSQVQYWLVAGVGTDALGSKLLDLAQAWWDARKPILGTNCLFSCLHYRNHSMPEQLVVYPGLTGTGGGEDIHPQYQVVRLNVYSELEILDSQIHRNATNISGVIEDLSTRGRINDLAEFENARAFEAQQFDEGPTGLTLNPQVRWLDQGPVPPVYRYTPAFNAVINTTFLTLRSRKTSLCM